MEKGPIHMKISCVLLVWCRYLPSLKSSNHTLLFQTGVVEAWEAGHGAWDESEVMALPKTGGRGGGGGCGN